MNNQKPIQTRLGSVAYTLLEIRRATLQNFFTHFNINYVQYCDDDKPCLFKDLKLTPNFVFFLIENKTFIKLYEQDYYSDKSIEIIANKIYRKENDVIDYFAGQDYKISQKYPYRYRSSYAIDFALQKDKYKFLNYNIHHRYEGNYEYRRANYSN